MKFVSNIQYDESNKPELITFGEQLVKDYPEVGYDGVMSLYYTGATSTIDDKEYAVFMFINKTEVHIKKDLTFKIIWTYNEESIYSDISVDYKIEASGELPPETATVLPLPLTEQQLKIVQSIEDEEQMVLVISDVKAVEERRSHI